MSTCRETADLWHWLRHDPKLFIKRKMWRNDYFWHDSFGKYWNRFIGCRLNGHKDVHRIEEGCINSNPRWYCFACETEVDPSKVDKGKRLPNPFSDAARLAQEKMKEGANHNMNASWIPEQPEPKPVFSSPDEIAKHQEENLRKAIGDELYKCLKYLEGKEREK